MFTYLALVSPPIALAFDVFARSLAEVGRADDDDLEALRPGLVASPGTGRDAHRVPLIELDDLVVELHPPAPAHDDVHLLLRPVRERHGRNRMVPWLRSPIWGQASRPQARALAGSVGPCLGATASPLSAP